MSEQRSAPVTVLLFYGAYGIALAGLGASWPTIRDRIHASTASLGAVLLLYGAARSLSAVVIVHLRPARLQSSLVVAGLEMLGGLALIASAIASRFTIFTIGFTVFGLAAGALDAALSTGALLTGRVKSLLGINTAFAVGTVLGPLIVLVVNRNTNDVALRSIWVILIPGITLLILAPFGFRGGQRKGVASFKARSETKVRPAWLVGFALTIAVVAGSETALGGWIPSLASNAWHYSTSEGAFAVTIYWIAFAFGRLVATLYAEMRTSLAVAISSAVLGVAAFGLASETINALYLVAAIAGFALGPMFPVLLASINPSGDRPRVVGQAILFSTIGSAIIPAVVGVLWPSHATPALIGTMVLPMVCALPYVYFTKDMFGHE